MVWAAPSEQRAIITPKQGAVFTADPLFRAGGSGRGARFCPVVVLADLDLGVLARGSPDGYR
jgi:hypothetical protein